ncbi:hypothetical protein MBLNU457_3946t2 [Dothideomycetes sp. NU457]
MIQCDGLRPSCRTCRVKNIPCSYNAEPDATPIVHLKRQFEKLQKESLPTRRFLEALKTSPWPDAVQLLQRLRTTRDVTAALEDFRLPPDLLRLTLENDDFGEGPSSQSALDDTAWNEGETSPLRNDNESETADFGVGTHLPGHVFDVQSQRSSESPHGASGTGSDSHQLTGPGIARDSTFNRGSPAFLLPGPSQPSASSHTSFNPRGPSRGQIDSASMRTLLGRDLSNFHAVEWGITYADDDEILNILASFMAWDHPCRRFFDEHVFLDGLVAGGSEFCSTLLVHTVLAYGAKNYAFENPTVGNTVEHFALVQAKTIFAFEAGHDTPATIAAGVMIHIIYLVNGDDKAGHQYLAQAIKMGQNIGLFDVKSASTGPNEHLRARALSVLAWGIFAHQSSISLNMHEFPLLADIPSVEKTFQDLSFEEDLWEAYPRHLPAKQSLTNSIFAARASLYAIVNGMIPLHKKYESNRLSNDYMEGVKSLADQLNDWYNTLAFPLAYLANATPHHLALHFQYHQTIIELWRPLLAAAETESPIESERQNVYQIAINSCRSSFQSLRHLVDSYAQSYSESPMSAFFQIPLLYIAFHAMNDPQFSDPSSEADHFFKLAIHLLRRMVGPFNLVYLVLQGIQKSAQKRNLTLPEQSQQILNELEQERPAIANLDAVRSLYPVDLSTLHEDLEGSRLENLLGKQSS